MASMSARHPALWGRGGQTRRGYDALAGRVAVPLPRPWAPNRGLSCPRRQCRPGDVEEDDGARRCSCHPGRMTIDQSGSRRAESREAADPSLYPPHLPTSGRPPLASWSAGRLLGRWSSRSVESARRVTIVLAVVGALGATLLALTGTPSASPTPSPLSQLSGGWPAQAFTTAANRFAVLGAVALIASWLVLLPLVRRGLVDSRRIWRIALIWMLPLAAGAPLLSADVHAYAADGIAVVQHFNPYVTGPGGGGMSASLVDPRWVDVPAPYGPVALLVFRVAAMIALGHPAITAELLVLFTVAAVALTGVFIGQLVGDRERPLALALWLLNPLVLISLIAGAHVDALLAVGIAGAILAWRRGHPLLAVGLASAATAVKISAAVAVGVFLVTDVLASNDRVRIAVRDAAVALGVYLVPSIWVGNPLGIWHAMTQPLWARTRLAPTDIITSLVSPLGIHRPVVAAVVLAVSISACGWLALTARRRGVLRSTAEALALAAISGPMFFGWYLTWALPCYIALNRRRWLVPIVVISMFAVLTGLPSPLSSF